MSEKGTLKLRVKEGESIWVGDVEIILDEISYSGWSVSLVFKADRSIKILRGNAREKETGKRF